MTPTLPQDLIDAGWQLKQDRGPRNNFPCDVWHAWRMSISGKVIAGYYPQVETAIMVAEKLQARMDSGTRIVESAIAEEAKEQP